MDNKVVYSQIKQDMINFQLRPFCRIIEQKEENIKCPICGSDNNVAKRRRNTYYLNDTKNWMLSCLDCYDEDVENFDFLWGKLYCE